MFQSPARVGLEKNTENLHLCSPYLILYLVSNSVHDRSIQFCVAFIHTRTHLRMPVCTHAHVHTNILSTCNYAQWIQKKTPQILMINKKKTSLQPTRTDKHIHKSA